MRRGNPATNHAGSDESDGSVVEGPEAHALVNLDSILKRFNEESGKSLKEPTKHDYANNFKRFADGVNLRRFTKKQLAGPKGRGLILRYLNNAVSRRSWTIVEAKLKAVWTYGVGLPWPITKRDVPEIPRPNSTRTPPDQIVRGWRDAFEREDVYARLEFKMYAQLGLRPSHLQRLLWEDVKNATGAVCWSTSDNDTPFMVEADGYVRGFKRFAWVRAWLPPDLQAALTAWKEELGAKWRPERPILPFRDGRGNLDAARMQQKWAMVNRWAGYIKRWNLPKLTARDFRKFVRSKCVSSGMDEVARCYLQGHAPQGMDGVYDNPEMRDLADRQMSRLPRGALGAIADVTVKVTDTVTKAEVDAIADWKAKKIGDLELLERLQGLRQRL